MPDGVGVTVRPSLKHAGALVIALGMIVFLGGVLNRYRYEPGHGRLPISTAVISAMVFSIVVVGVLMTIAARIRVRAGPGGLEISSGGRRTIIPWDRVNDVSFDAANEALRVRLSDGTERAFKLPYLSGHIGHVAGETLMRACGNYRSIDLG